MADPLYLNIGTRSSSASAASLNPALPASRVNGNILIATVGSANNATHSCATAGWAILGTQTNSGALWTRSRWWRVVDGTEAAPTITWTGAAASFAQVEQYDRDNTDFASPFGTIGTASTGTLATHTSTGFNTIRDGSLVLYDDACIINTGLGTPSGWVENYDNGSATGATNNAGGSKAVAMTGSASGNISVTGGVAAWVQQQVELLAPTIASGSMCAGRSSGGFVLGYLVAAYATTLGLSEIGTIGGSSTAFGVVAGLGSSAGAGFVTFTSPVGTPTGITINGTLYPIAYGMDDGTYFQYNIDAAFTGFTDTVTYTWGFGASSGFFLMF